MNVSGSSSLGAQYFSPPVQRPTAVEVANSFFSAVDPTGSGSFDKNALSGIVDKVSISSSAVDAMFSLMDSNADGSVTKQEFTDLLQTIKPQGESQLPGSPPPGGMGPPMAGGPPPSKSESSTSTDPADTNGDGIVSTAEALAAGLSTSASADIMINSDSLSEENKRGDDLMVSKVMQMLSSYALAETGQVTSESSWYS